MQFSFNFVKNVCITAGFSLVVIALSNAECNPYTEPDSFECRAAVQVGCDVDPWAPECAVEALAVRMSANDKVLYERFLHRRTESKDVPGLCCFEEQVAMVEEDPEYVTNALPCVIAAVAGRPHCQGVGVVRSTWQRMKSTVKDTAQTAYHSVVHTVFPPACLGTGEIRVVGPSLPCDPENPLHSCSKWFDSHRRGAQCAYIYPRFPEDQFCLFAVPDGFCVHYTQDIYDRSKCRMQGIGYFERRRSDVEFYGLVTAVHVWKQHNALMSSSSWQCNHTTHPLTSEAFKSRLSPYVVSTVHGDAINVHQMERHRGQECMLTWPALRQIMRLRVHVQDIDYALGLLYIATTQGAFPEKGFSGSPCFLIVNGTQTQTILGVYGGHSYISGYYLAF